MKKILLAIVFLFLLSSYVTSAGIEKCVIPNGVEFGVIHNYAGMLKVYAVGDNNINILEITKVEHPPGVVNVVTFSMLYDKPKFTDHTRRIYTYEMYAPLLGYDKGFVKYDDLKDCYKGTPVKSNS